MHRMTQNYLKPLTVKSTLHARSTYPQGPNVGPFHFMTSGFQDTRWLKIGNAPNERKLNLPT